MLSEGLKTEIEFCRDFAPDLTGLAYTAPPDLLVGMAGKLAAPVPKNLTPSIFRASALEHRPYWASLDPPCTWIFRAMHQCFKPNHPHVYCSIVLVQSYLAETKKTESS